MHVGSQLKKRMNKSKNTKPILPTVKLQRVKLRGETGYDSKLNWQVLASLLC